MKTRIIHTKFWKDSYISSLQSDEKLLFLYLVINERVNIVHCYEITIREIVFDTSINEDRVLEILHKFSADNKIIMYKGWILLLNAIKYETYKGDLSEKGKKNIYKEMPVDILEWYNNSVIRTLEGPLKGANTISNMDELIIKKKEMFNV